MFLHGISYTGDVWKRLGVTELLSSKRIPFLALDMPYGMRSSCQPRTRSPEKNITFARAAVEKFFGDRAPILVGASLGGHLALKYASMFPVRGLLLISPARALENDFVDSYSSFKFPVRIIWGTEDNIVSGEELRVLVQKLPNARLVVYEGSGHSAYVNQPDRFKRDLLELFASAEQGNI